MKRPKANGGFTLVELMIALGILAFALPMIGTAFLAGMVENKESNDNTMLTLVAENAISIASSRLNETALTGFTETLAPVPKSVVNPGELEWRPYGQAGLNYPADPVAENAAGVYACVLFVRHWPGTTGNVVGDYQIVAMVFRKAGTINWSTASVDASSTVAFAANGAVDVKNSKVSVNSVLQSVMGGYQVRMSLRP